MSEHSEEDLNAKTEVSTPRELTSTQGHTARYNGVEKRLSAVKSCAPFRLWDLLIYGLLFFAILGILLAVLIPRKAAAAEMFAVVAIDGTEVARYSLADNREIPFLHQGEELLTLVIKDHRLTVRHSTCPDHICEKMELKATGQQVVCLPRKLCIFLLDDTLGGGTIIPGSVG